MAFPGWTWEYIDECMTLPRLEAIQRHWRRRPPLHWMVADFLGVKPPPERVEGGAVDGEPGGSFGFMVEQALSGAVPLLDG